MAIKQLLELIGDDIVIGKLDKVKKKGEEVLESFNKSGGLKFDVDPKPIEETSGHVVKLTEILHTLRPILQAAGLQFSEFGALTRLAGTSLLALGAATAGAVVFGLAKLEENAARTKGALTDLFGSQSKGEQAFSALEKQAGKFGSTVEGLAPGLEAFQTALNNVDRTAKGFVALRAEDLPGASLAKNVDAVTESYGNFIKILRAGRLSQSDAEKTAKSFFDALKEGGPIAKAALQSLPVGSLQLIKEALGAAGLTSKAFFEAIDSGQITLDQFQVALGKFGPQADKAFQTKAIKTFSDEIGKLLSELNEGFRKLSGGGGFSDFVIGELKRISAGINATFTDLDRIIKVFQFLNSFGKAQFDASVGRAISDLTTKPQQGFDEAGFEELGKTAARAFGKGFVNAPEAGQALGSLNKLFKDNPNFKEPVKIPPVNKDEFQKSLDDLKGRVDHLFDNIERGPGPVLPIPKSPPPTGTVLGPSPIAFGTTMTGGARIDSIGLASFTGPVTIQNLLGGGGGGGGGGDRIRPPPEFRKASFGEDVQSLDTSGMVESFRDAEAKIEEIWTGLLNFLSSSIGKINLGSIDTSAIESAIDRIKIKLDELIQKAREASQGLSGIGGGGGLPGDFGAGFAGGGIVRGRGSTTSDSILAFLSNREFVVNARAVSHYGSDLFAALNAMKLPRDFIGRFNMGGLARAISGNRFAAGGSVSTTSGNRSLTLVLDQKRFSVTGSKGTIDDLEREASLRGLAMIGKAPSWIR